MKSSSNTLNTNLTSTSSTPNEDSESSSAYLSLLTSFPSARLIKLTSVTPSATPVTHTPSLISTLPKPSETMTSSQSNVLKVKSIATKNNVLTKVKKEKHFLVGKNRLIHRTTECPGIIAAETKTGQTAVLNYDTSRAKRGCKQHTCFPE